MARIRRTGETLQISLRGISKKKLRLALRRGAARWLKLDRDDQVIRSYLATPGKKKLQIGCGRHFLPVLMKCD
jgi:hypothetical protein